MGLIIPLIFIMLGNVSILQASRETCNGQVVPEAPENEKVLCIQADKCHRTGPFRIFSVRNCFCDDLCVLYGDCCPGHAAKPGVKPLPTEIFSCKDVEGIWSMKSPIYIVDKCNPGWPDGMLKNACESDSVDILKNWPVSDTMRIVYKNAFCLQCNGKNLTSAIFWNSNCKCNVSDSSTDGAETLIQKYMNNRDTCRIDYVHPNGNNYYRNCKIGNAKCPPGWTNDCVKENCEGPNTTIQYRYETTTGKTYKNSFCALCMGSREITCKDVATRNKYRAALLRDRNKPAYPLIITIDLSQKNLKVQRKAGLGYKTSTESMENCAKGKGQIYDVFIGRCRIVDFSTTEGAVFDVGQQSHKTCQQYIPLSPSQYVMQPDGSVYVNATMKIHSKSSFFFRRSGTIVMCIDKLERHPTRPSYRATSLEVSNRATSLEVSNRATSLEVSNGATSKSLEVSNRATSLEVFKKIMVLFLALSCCMINN